MNSSQRENIIVLWTFWHFFEMPAFLVSVWKNYIFFGLNYFSVPLLAKTLFSPWRRYKWAYPRGFDPVEFFNTLVSNIFSRFLGALCRIVLIIIGCIAQVFILLAGPIVILVWVLIPFIIVGALFYVFYI